MMLQLDNSVLNHLKAITCKKSVYNFILIFRQIHYISFIARLLYYISSAHFQALR